MIVLLLAKASASCDASLQFICGVIPLVHLDVGNRKSEFNSGHCGSYVVGQPGSSAITVKLSVTHFHLTLDYHLVRAQG